MVTPLPKEELALTAPILLTVVLSDPPLLVIPSTLALQALA